MTDRPMTEEERVLAEEAARRIVFHASTGDVDDWTYEDAQLVARALLSTSAAVRGMREALEKCLREMRGSIAFTFEYEDAITAGEKALAVLSGIETEQAQARATRSAPISTDTKGTTK